jgi:hypothetical protein
MKLESTSLANPMPPGAPDPGPLIITDPNLQSLTAASDHHLYRVQSKYYFPSGGGNTITAYAMGIKFEPVMPGPGPGPKPGLGTDCDRLIPLKEPQCSGSVNAGVDETKVLDGDLNTRWVSTTIPNPWISVGLEVQKPVCRVEIAWADGNVRKYKFYIESSLNQQNWSTILISGQSQGNAFESYVVSATMAKYVKVTVTGTNPIGAAGGTTAQMSEIRVFSNQ